MSVFALADLHLALASPDKSMEVFGWLRYQERIAENWRSSVTDDDLVLIAGDISWAMRLQDALIDLNWLHELPGQKLLLRGNHDYWWPSLTKLQGVLPSSLHAIHNTAFHWKGCSFAGARLWDTAEYSFGPQQATDDKIFLRELQRLERSLEQLSPTATHRIALTHYPPISCDLAPSRASQLLEKYGVNICVFGHLHGQSHQPFGSARGVTYYLTAADYLNFTPLRILTL